MRRIAVFVLFALSVSLHAWGCENQFVRDVAFLEGRDVHRLSAIGGEGDEEARSIYERLEEWLAPLRPDLNLELHYLSIDDLSVSWGEFGIPSAPPSTPVVLLSGFRSFERSAFYIQHWEGDITDGDFQKLITSPAREFVAREAARHLAVLLYVPALGGADTGVALAGGDPGVEGILERVVESYAEEPLPLIRLRVERTDEREDILTAFFGIKPDGPDFVAVVFGRGKAMPPLMGGDICEVNIRGQLEELKGDCSCLLSTLSLGVDLPMMWPEEADESVVTLASLAPMDDGLSEIGLHASHSIYTALWTMLLLVPLVLFAGGGRRLEAGGCRSEVFLSL